MCARFCFYMGVGGEGGGGNKILNNESRCGRRAPLVRAIRYRNKLHKQVLAGESAASLPHIYIYTHTHTHTLDPPSLSLSLSPATAGPPWVLYCVLAGPAKRFSFVFFYFVDRFLFSPSSCFSPPSSGPQGRKKTIKSRYIESENWCVSGMTNGCRNFHLTRQLLAVLYVAGYIFQVSKSKVEKLGPFWSLSLQH